MNTYAVLYPVGSVNHKEYIEADFFGVDRGVLFFYRNADKVAAFKEWVRIDRVFE